MKKQKTKNNLQKVQNYVREQTDIANSKAALNRARSISIGTCFGGYSEIMMRTADGQVLWCSLQPVEIIELIHQLAANVGCHIGIMPREDFSSWRNWNHTEEELAHYRGKNWAPATGWPPHVSSMAPFVKVGADMPKAEEQPGLNLQQMLRSNENEPMATKKTVNRRNTKRSTTTT